MPRSCGAGGCVSHHAMQDGIGSLQVYDNIANLLKDERWNGVNAKRVSVKMEHVRNLLLITFEKTLTFFLGTL